MVRNAALILGGALLLGQGAVAPVHAAPMAMAMPHLHMQRFPKPRTIKPKPADKPAEPSQQFHGLMAAEQPVVRTRLGAPDVARGEGSGAMWTYRLPDCALYVFFKAPKGQADAPLRVSGATSGPRVRGQHPLPVNDCIAQAMGRQGGTP